MATVEVLENQIATLGEADFKRLAAWFHEFEKGFDEWDKQMANDAELGKLDILANRAREHRRAGRMTDI